MTMRSSYLLLPIIIILIAASYLNTLDSPPILDDQHSFLFTSKLQLKDLSLQSLNSLKENSFGASRFLPILSLCINNYFAQGRALDYHVTNISIHFLTTLALLFFLIQLLNLPHAFKSLKVIDPLLFATAVTGLWALSPIQTNAVTYIVQRMASICALFYLLCLGLYLKGRRESSPRKAIFAYTGAALAAICAFFSKENSATLPLAIILLENTFISPGMVTTFITKFIRKHWLPIAILILLLAPLFQTLWANYVLDGYKLRDFSLSERLLTESRVMVWYVTLLLLPLPSRMNIDHNVMISHSLFAPITTIFSILILVALLLFANRTRRNMPLVSFGIMFFFLNLLIESSIIPLELLFEHRLYLPSVGFFLTVIALADYGVSQLPNVGTREARNIITVSLIIMFTICSILTTYRNLTFRDELTIYADMAEKSPDKARSLNNYGMALSQANRPEEAIDVIQKAFAMGHPNQEAYYATLNNLLAAYGQKGNIEYSIDKTMELLTKVPAYAQVNHLDRLSHNLAYAYYQTGQFDKAYKCISQALLLFPQESNNLSTALYMEIIGRAYNNPLYKEKLGLDGSSEEEAVLLKTIAALINVRDYSKATELISKLAIINPIKAAAYGQSLKVARQRTKSAKESAEINNDLNFNKSVSSLWRVHTANFIVKHYKPLIPIVPFLINTVALQFPEDPFVIILRLQTLEETNPEEAITYLVKDVLPKHPDFPPFLMSAFRLSYAKNYDFAYQVGSHLLDIYPEAPGWKKILLYLAAYENISKKSEFLPIHPGDKVFSTLFD